MGIASIQVRVTDSVVRLPRHIALDRPREDQKDDMLFSLALGVTMITRLHLERSRMLPFRLQLEDGLPVSEQLVRAAKRAILGGELTGGEIFPSVRVVAQELRVSPTTVHKAVLELKESGYVVSRSGVVVVVGKEKLGKAALKEQLRARCEDLWKEANFLGLGAKELGELLREIEHEKEKGHDE